MSNQLPLLDMIHKEAVKFVEDHYPTITDKKDKKITILATMNQLIELMRIANLPKDPFLNR